MPSGAGEEPSRRLVGVAAVGPVNELQTRDARRVLGVRPLELGNDHPRVPTDGDDQHGDALGDSGRRITRQVQQVGTRGHQQPGQSGLLGRVCRLHSARREVVGAERNRPLISSVGHLWCPLMPSLT
jgi:hypothetical protein